MSVSIIQSGSLLPFNGPSANVLSGRRGPRVQSHFNGCNDERLKSERRDRVTLAGMKERGRGLGGQVRGLKGGGRWPRWAGVRPADDGGTQEGGIKEEGAGGRGQAAFVCQRIGNDDALTSLTFGWRWLPQARYVSMGVFTCTVALISLLNTLIRPRCVDFTAHMMPFIHSRYY